MDFPQQPTQILQNLTRLQELLNQNSYDQIAEAYHQGQFSSEQIVEGVSSNPSDQGLELLGRLGLSVQIPAVGDPEPVLEYLRSLSPDPEWPLLYADDPRESVRNFLQERFPGIQLPELKSSPELIADSTREPPPKYFEVRQMLEDFSESALSLNFNKFPGELWELGLRNLSLDQYQTRIQWALNQDLNPMAIIPTPVHAEIVLKQDLDFETLAVIFGNAWVPFQIDQPDQPGQADQVNQEVQITCPPEWREVLIQWGKILKQNPAWEQFYAEDPEISKFLQELI